MLLCDSTTERLDMSALRWNTQANFRHSLWKWSVAWNVGLDLTMNWMDIENPLAKHDGVSYNVQRLYAYPSLSYENKRLRVNASPRVSWLRREYEEGKGNDMLFEPMVFLCYKQSSSLEYGMTYLLTCMAGDMDEVCDAMIAAITIGDISVPRPCSPRPITSRCVRTTKRTTAEQVAIVYAIHGVLS